MSDDLRSIGHWIGGKPDAGGSGRTAPVFDPARGVQTAEVALATAAEVDAARREASRTLTDPRWPVKPAVAKGIRAALAALERAAGAWARA